MFHAARVLFLGLALSVSTATAQAATYYTYGDVSLTASGFLTTSSNPSGYGGIVQNFTSSPFSLSSLTTLSVDYQMTQGTFGGGSPRFTIFDTNGDSAGWVYLGTPIGGGSFADPLSGAAGNTGNYADLLSTDVRVYVGNTGLTWAQFVAANGSLQVGYVSLDLDGGWAGTQQALFNNFTVNDTVVTAAVPEPSTWAMMILGFAGIGYMMYRRRKDAALAA